MGAVCYRKWERVRNQRNFYGQIEWGSLHLLLTEYEPVPESLLGYYQELIVEMDEVYQRACQDEEEHKKELEKLKKGKGAK